MAREYRSQQSSSSLAITRITAAVRRVRAVERAAVAEQHGREWPLAVRAPDQAAESERPALHHDRIRSNKTLVFRVRRNGKNSNEGDSEHAVTPCGVAA